MSAQGDLCTAIITAVTASVSGATDWHTHSFEPIHHQGNGDHLAVWFDGEVNRPEFNTTAGSGHLDQRETYVLRFWRQAPEGAYDVVNETEAGLVLDLYNSVYGVLQQHQTYDPTTQYYVKPVAGRMLVGGTSEAKIRGFEISIQASRARGFS